MCGTIISFIRLLEVSFYIVETFLTDRNVTYFVMAYIKYNI